MSSIVECLASVLSPTHAALERQLRTCPYWSVRQLVCQLDRGHVIVRGTVPSYYLKQVAESLAAKVVGLEAVECEIEVRDD